MKDTRRAGRDVEQLLHEIDNLELILDALHGEIIITDGLGTVKKVSPTFLARYRVEKEDILEKGIGNLSRRTAYNAMAIETVLKTIKEYSLHQEEAGRSIVITAQPVLGDDGTLANVFAYSKSITEILALKEQYQELENQMRLCTTELETLRKKSTGTDGVIVNSQGMQRIINCIDHVAPFNANVLLTGETGVGKSMFAKLIHKKSKQSAGAFIEINCGAIPENLLESELFGYERGAFTGASREGKMGLVELAQNGTLFLDEVSELPLEMQVKLLKMIQEKKIIKVGGEKEIHVDFRLIAATNRDLESMIARGSFREDLYYRLNVIEIKIPPLRERREDIVPLAAFFLERYNRQYNLSKSISQQLYYEMMTKRSWPGNIRELQHTVERLVLMSEKELITVLADLESESGGRTGAAGGTKDEPGGGLREARERVERELVTEAFRVHKTTVAVAKALKISQTSAVRLIKKYTAE